MFKDLIGQTIETFQLKILTINPCYKTLLSQYKHSSWNFILKNHQYNILLWDEEDLARRREVADSEIAKNKRNIDQYNQKRNDYIEKIDEAIIESIPTSHKFKTNAWVNSETAGSIIDRMSINALRIFNMKKKIYEEDNIIASIKEDCKIKLNTLNHQRTHLNICFDNLLTAIVKGEAIFKTYKQFKMYNDPNLNPYLNFDKKHA
ncbi:MAG: DUF4254 domain-containing protein [Rickettsiales bacterium]|nr:DUF4254 domain-containing protein [Rickettsiales bacterium]